MPQNEQSDKAKATSKGHFTIMPNVLYRTYLREIGPSALAVYGLIRTMSGTKTSYSVGIRYLARTSGMSPNTVLKGLRILERAKLIRIEDTPGRHRYHVLE